MGTPLTEINKTHTAISAIDMNSYAVTLSTAPTIAGASTSAEVGKSTVYASENYRLETLRTQISTLDLNRTSVNGSIRTTGTSPSGSETSFSTDTTASAIPLNENFDLDTSRIIASPTNETK